MLLFKEIDQDAPTTQSIKKYIKDAGVMLLGFDPTFVSNQLMMNGKFLVPIIQKFLVG